MKAAAAAAAAAASSIPAVSSGADIDTDELVDETGVEPKDIELIMSQVHHYTPRFCSVAFDRRKLEVEYIIAPYDFKYYPTNRSLLNPVGRFD